MKAQILVFAVSAMVVSTMGQTTNEYHRGRIAPRQEWEKGGQHKQRRPKLTPGQKERYQEHRLQFMEKSLKKIGVTEEQKTRIVELQKTHKDKMRANMERSRIVRDKLTQLQDSNATEQELAAAIDEICAVQKEQLWILVQNRKEMEQILGKEKYALFMEKARTQFRSHGRRGGSGMSSRPEFSRPSAEEGPHNQNSAPADP
jgi:hypothetical protein